MGKEWTDQQIDVYFRGIACSDYPAVFWEKMTPYLAGCTSLIDVGSGPGAFALQALAAGFFVQAVDVDGKNLRALREKAASLGFLERCRILQGDWLAVKTEKADAVVCAYSMGGSIGTAAGIAKAARMAPRALFFLAPYAGTFTDFQSLPLYEKAGIEPPTYGGYYRGVLEILKGLGLAYVCETVEYDFGFPADWADEDTIARFLAEKLQLPDLEEVRKHCRDIVEIRNGRRWLPNRKKAVLIRTLISG